MNGNSLWPVLLQLLEIEIKKLHQSTKEATERFDENLAKLLEKKVNCTVAIYQVSHLFSFAPCNVFYNILLKIGFGVSYRKSSRSHISLSQSSEKKR